MAELHVSATDFRVHLKDLANDVARGGEAVVMARHGLDMVVMISWEDYQKWARLKSREPKRVPLEHPDLLEVAEVERIYGETSEATDDATLAWRSKALISLWARKRRGMVDPPS